MSSNTFVSGPDFVELLAIAPSSTETQEVTHYTITIKLENGISNS